MDAIEFEQNGSCIDDMSIEQFDSSDAYNVFGEPEILPRIGSQYQVEIPPLIGKSDQILYRSNPAEVESHAGVPFKLLMGLPIPLIWINQGRNIKQETTEFHGDSDISSYRYESFESSSIKKPHFCSEKEITDITTEGPDVQKENEASEDKQQQRTLWGSHLVPGTVVDAWDNSERASFLLGLYIFGKNFVQLKRFVESKRMGDILLFYYGKFYGSPEYRRWSDCRKMKIKRIVCGEKLFTGLRQQELLSRMLPTISEECQNALWQVTKTFGEGKMSLEDYVFSLKAMLGTNTLVEAFGIGKGKQDLTCMAVEPSRVNQVIPLRSEIPAGKACAALEPREIIKFLTGDYRLSKARSSDLFWEAVWPRLLARGWQSEQPKNEAKDSLVFLVPGIKRFSRRKLVKGQQYYDSITDVLTKVASEPTLLELSSEGEGNKGTEEVEGEEVTPETKEEPDDMQSRTRLCYLQPRTPKRNNGTMKFTVVDTSLTSGKPYRVRELRSLPLEASNNPVSTGHCENSDQSTSEVMSDKSDTVNTELVDQGKIDYAISTNMPNGKPPDKKDHDISDAKRETYSVCADSANGPMSGSRNIRNLYDGKQSKKVSKFNLNQRLKRENVGNLAPVTKRRRRLTACSHQEMNNVTSNSSTVPISEPELPSSCSGDSDGVSPVASSQDKLSSTVSSKGCQPESIECVHGSDSHVAEHLAEASQTRTLIDLNVLPVAPDFESGVFMTGSLAEQDYHSNHKSEDINAVKMPADLSALQPETVSRRHSTRNRPPTARALEALANGFLSVSNRPRKNKETSSLENLSSRISQRPSSGPGVTELSASSGESRVDEGGSGACNGGSSNIYSELHVLPDGYRPPTGVPQFF